MLEEVDPIRLHFLLIHAKDRNVSHEMNHDPRATAEWVLVCLYHQPGCFGPELKASGEPGRWEPGSLSFIELTNP